MKPLQFITMNTGHLLGSKRSEVSDDVIALIDRSLDGDGELIDGWRVAVDLHDGAYATFCVLADDIALALCAVCWRVESSPSVWQAMCATEEVRTSAWPGVVQQPPHVPWLATTILPSAGTYSARFGEAKATDRLYTLGDLERCVAWTLIERSNRKSDGSG